jgi:hypothetical protein
MQELPDLPSKLRQIAVLVVGKVSVYTHICIVSRYKFSPWEGAKNRDWYGLTE